MTTNKEICNVKGGGWEITGQWTHTHINVDRLFAPNIYTVCINLFLSSFTIQGIPIVKTPHFLVFCSHHSHCARSFIHGKQSQIIVSLRHIYSSFLVLFWLLGTCLLCPHVSAVAFWARVWRRVVHGAKGRMRSFFLPQANIMNNNTVKKNIFYALQIQGCNTLYILLYPQYLLRPEGQPLYTTQLLTTDNAATYSIKPHWCRKGRPEPLGHFTSSTKAIRKTTISCPSEVQFGVSRSTVHGWSFPLLFYEPAAIEDINISYAGSSSGMWYSMCSVSFADYSMGFV